MLLNTSPGDNDSLNAIQRRASEFANYLQAAMDWHTNTTNIAPVTSAASSLSWSEPTLYVRANCAADGYWASWNNFPTTSMPFPGMCCTGNVNHYDWQCINDVGFFFSGTATTPTSFANFYYNPMTPDMFCGSLQGSDCQLLLQIQNGMRNDTLPGLCGGKPQCAAFTKSGATVPLVPPDNYDGIQGDLGSNAIAQYTSSHGAPCNATSTLMGNPAYTDCFSCYRSAQVWFACCFRSTTTTTTTTNVYVHPPSGG